MLGFILCGFFHSSGLFLDISAVFDPDLHLFLDVILYFMGFSGRFCYVIVARIGS